MYHAAVCTLSKYSIEKLFPYATVRFLEIIKGMFIVAFTDKAHELKLRPPAPGERASTS